MSYETKPGTGALFKNNYKEKESHPNAKGTIVTPDGKEWEIASWTKKDRNGNPFQSLSISEPYQKANAVGGRNDPQAPLPDNKDDDLPF